MISKESWRQLPEPRRDQLLLELGWMMIGDNLRLITHRRLTPEQLKSAHTTVNETRARVYSWSASLLGVLTLIIAAAVLTASVSWIMRVLAILGAATISIMVSRHLFSVSLIQAAKASPQAFFELWRSGALRVEVRGEQYDAFSEPNRWQDVLLLAAGWRDLMAREPVTRGQQLANAVGVART